MTALTVVTVATYLLVAGSSPCRAEEGLVGMWSFDEGSGANAADSSGNGNHGTIHGAQWVAGISSNALQFDGDDYVDCGNAGVLSFGATNDFTIEAWVQLHEGTEDNAGAVGKSTGSGEGYRLIVERNAPAWTWEIQTEIEDTEGDQVRRFSPPWASLSTNEWHHWVWVVDRSAFDYVYIDAVERTGSQWPGGQAVTMPNIGDIDNAAPLYVGRSGSAYLHGIIDEVRVYNRALSEDEIREHYTNVVPELPPATLIKFGITADPHSRFDEAVFTAYFNDMNAWQPDFVVDLGDFAIQQQEGQTTPEMHDWQLSNLVYNCALFSNNLSSPFYPTMGNHDAGWLMGADEVITPDDLYAGSHGGEDITKAEWVATSGMPHRYYSFDVNGYHFIVLDGNNWRGATAVPEGHDGTNGAYWVDDTQKAWLAADLATNRAKTKVVFCHQELHHTPPEGSGEGGNAPFPPVGNEGSYVDNGWELRELFAADGNVLACFFGHKHDDRWTVYGGVNYVTVKALHVGAYAKVWISDKMYVGIVGSGQSYEFDLPVLPKPAGTVLYVW